MKKNENSIPYVIRKLIQNRDIQGMIADLYKNRISKNVFNIYLPLVNERFTDLCIDQYHDHTNDFDNSISRNDMVLLNELEKLQIINNDGITEDEDGDGQGLGFVAMVTIINPQFIELLYKWIKDTELIINYGIFSLHTFSGEAYCQDNKGKFHTGKGLFRVFLTFLKEKNHILDYSRIYKIYHEDEKNVDMEKMVPEDIHQIIHDIKDNLSMKGSLSKLFMPSSNQYILYPGSAS